MRLCTQMSCRDCKGMMGTLQNCASATLLFCVSSLKCVGRRLIRLCPNARDENLNSTENLCRAYMFRCVRPVRACLTWCNESVVHFSRCRTSFGDFQRVFLTRSPHRYASLMGFGATRRSCGDCRHQSAQGSSGVNMACYWVKSVN